MTIATPISGKSEISVCCYVHNIPPFIESGLISLYGTLHSSLSFFKVFRPTEDISCYVARRDQVPIAIILFCCKEKRIEVLNEMIEIDQQEIYRFTQYVFKEFPGIDIVNFKAVKTTTHRFGFLLQQYNAKDTYMIALPDTAQEYTASIGKSTRTSIRYQTNSVLRNYPSFRAEFYVNEDVDEQNIRRIIEFSENRISASTYKFKHDAERIIRLAKLCGFVTVLLIDGNVCAGSINYQVGGSYFGEVVGHDPAYEKYGLGKLVLYRAICESIQRGGKKFYLGGGMFDFKVRMMGTQINMDELKIYRSYGKFVLHFGTAARTTVDAHLRQVKQLVHRHKKKFLGQLAFKVFYLLRSRMKG